MVRFTRDYRIAASCLFDTGGVLAPELSMKKVLAAVAALACLVLALVFVLRTRVQTPPPSGWLVLPDGSSNRIVAVTYGTNHLIGSALGRMIARLPDAVQDELPVLIHRTETPRPALVLWIEHRGTPVIPKLAVGAAYERLTDGDGFMSGPQSSPLGCFGYADIMPAAFEAFPRRDPKLTVNFFNTSLSGQVTNCGSLQLPNPLHRAYPEWQPESLPAKKATSEFEVTLLGIHTGNDDTRIDLRMSQPAAGPNWQIVGVESSDATGNSIHNFPRNWSVRGNEIEFSLQTGLWPSEKAWKLKFEIARTRGFAPDTLLTFKNVPLGLVNSTNAVGWTTNFAGITLTLADITRHAPKTNAFDGRFQPSDVKFTNSRLPAGTRLDVLRIAYDQGATNPGESFSFSDSERYYSLSHIPLDAKTADFTFAVHQSRFVEFTVHPELPAPATNSAGRQK